MAVSPHTAQVLTSMMVNVDAAQEIITLLGGVTTTSLNIPTAPTAAAGTNSTQLATTAFVTSQDYSNDPYYSTVGGL